VVQTEDQAIDALEKLAGPALGEKAVLISKDIPTGFQLPVENRAQRGAARIVGYTPDVVKISCSSDGAGLLVYVENFHKKWKATVNGVDAPISIANYTFMSVAVPKGDSIVEFRYEDPLIKFLTLAGLFFYIGMLLSAVVIGFYPRFARQHD
jgi:uncharacterized membrane protein YfhO